MAADAAGPARTSPCSRPAPRCHPAPQPAGGFLHTEPEPARRQYHPVPRCFGVTCAPTPARLGAGSEERRRRFDVGRGPLIRFPLIELPDECWHLVIVAHHIAHRRMVAAAVRLELLALWPGWWSRRRVAGSAAAVSRLIGWLALPVIRRLAAQCGRTFFGLTAPHLLSPAGGVMKNELRLAVPVDHEGEQQ